MNFCQCEQNKKKVIMSVPSDKSYTNFRVNKNLVVGGQLTSQNATLVNVTIPGGNPGDVLMNMGSGNAQWSSNPVLSATINTGVTPTGMAINSTGTIGYVANNNNYGVSTGNYVSVIDLTTNMLSTNISSGTFNQPYTITLSADGSKAYVTNSAGSTISIIDTQSNTVVGTITGLDGPSGMVIRGEIAYVNNYGASGGVGSGNGRTVSIVDLITETVIGTLTVDQAPAAVALSPNELYLYVLCYVTGEEGTGTLDIISTQTNERISTISGFFGPFGFVIHPNGLYAYVSNFGSNNFDPFDTTVSVVNLTTYEITTTITLGIQPAGIAITPNGDFVYVSNYNTLYQVGSPTFSGLVNGQGTVNVIDTATNTLVPMTIVVGLAPSNITISPSGQYAYVSNFSSNTLSVIEVLK